MSGRNKDAKVVAQPLPKTLKKAKKLANFFGYKYQSRNEEKKVVKEFFDEEYYCSTYEDIRKNNLDPLLHFMLFGWKEGRNPCAWFSTTGYAHRYGDVKLSGMNPFYHYLKYGRKEGRTSVAPVVQAMHDINTKRVDSYTSQDDSRDDEINRIRCAISLEFDEEYYRRTYDDIDANNIDPLEHFVLFGWKEKRNPCAWFSTEAYLQLNRDVVDLEINPFYHYITQGRAEKRTVVPAENVVRELVVLPESSLVDDPQLLDLIKYPPRSLALSQGAFSAHSLDVHWVIPDFALGSGGHMTIFRMVRWLEIFGHRCTVWIRHPTIHQDNEAAYKDIVEGFQTLRGEVRLLSDDSFFGTRGDAVIATGWQTVPVVCHATMFKERFYFVQDYEPSFFPQGSYSLAAKLTYAQDLACICASPWLSEIMQKKYGRWARYFWLAYDHKVYFPNSHRVTTREKPRIVFYARKSTPRRAVELGLLALQALSDRGARFHVDLFGDNLQIYSAPFEATMHGILSQNELSRLYREGDLGICFSTTNYSLVPQEMMACGLPLIEIDVDSTRAIFPEGVTAFCGPDPSHIADKIEEMLKDPDRRQRQAEEALEWVQQFSWEKSARDVENALVTRLRERGYESQAGAAERHASSELSRPSGYRGVSSRVKVSVFIPTYNGGELLKRVIDQVRSQRAPWLFEIVVIDSSSTDGTGEYCETSADIVFERIPQSAFSHGGTRNRAVEIAQGDYVAFLTQDALPADEYWLYNLVSVLEHYPNSAGAFGKHIAYPESTPFTKRDIEEHFAQFDKFPLALSKYTNRTRWDSKDLGWRQILHYYSDNNSCLRRSVWRSIPYPNIEYGEDQVWAEQIIQAGYEKVYVPTAVVYHSHDYDARETYERALTEALFFRKMFGYNVVSKNDDCLEVIESLNQRDARWAKIKGVSEKYLADQKRCNEARIQGYFSAIQKLEKEAC